LFNRVFGPVRGAIASFDDLKIVGTGLIQSIPYGLLVNGPAGRDVATAEELRGLQVPWLIRSHSLSLLPSAAGSAIKTNDPAASRRKPFLGIGDPVLAAHDASARKANARNVEIGQMVKPNATLADVSFIRRLPSLPETEAELREIAGLLGAKSDDILLRERASEPTIKSSALSSYDIIAFATHGALAGEVVGNAEPGLVLTPPAIATTADDGFLSLSEIRNLKLAADLVILSACNTATSDGRPRAEALSGLVTAFFHAGAQNLLVTHWAIPSHSSVEITTNAVRVKRGENTIAWPKALQKAALIVADSSGPAEWAHPFFWAGFAAVEGALPAGAAR
jgi:CHAT domain-containing protein